MPVIPGLTTTVPARVPLFRCTATSYLSADPRACRNVVNGRGGVLSADGARYNHPGVQTVYLAEDVATCLAEQLYYFHRAVLPALDLLHLGGRFPHLQMQFVLWVVALRRPVSDVFQLSLANAPAAGVIPSLMLNPSQDYQHLKARRAHLQAQGYKGLRAPSSRVRGVGHMVVLFDDLSRNVASITPYLLDIRLLTAGAAPTPFTNHATDLLDFEAGEVRLAPTTGGTLPPALAPYAAWTRLEFNH